MSPATGEGGGGALVFMCIPGVSVGVAVSCQGHQDCKDISLVQT